MGVKYSNKTKINETTPNTNVTAFPKIQYLAFHTPPTSSSDDFCIACFFGATFLHPSSCRILSISIIMMVAVVVPMRIGYGLHRKPIRWGALVECLNGAQLRCQLEGGLLVSRVLTRQVEDCS